MSDAAAARLEGARAALARAGLAGVGLAAAGPEREVLAITAPPVLLPRLRALAPALKEAGFRYVTLDLEPTGPRAHPDPGAGA